MKLDVAAALHAAADALYEATPHLTHVDLLRERTLDAGATARRAANQAREEGQTEGRGPNGWEYFYPEEHWSNHSRHATLVEGCHLCKISAQGLESNLKMIPTTHHWIVAVEGCHLCQEAREPLLPVVSTCRDCGHRTCDDLEDCPVCGAEMYKGRPT